MKDNPKTARNQVKRIPKRGKYDSETINKILDEGFLCHVGFNVGEQPFVIPTLYARIDNSIIIHGSSISRMLKNIEKGVKICLTVTHADGIVLARSAFHHSMNYRSAVVFGSGKLIVEKQEKLAALKAVSDNILKYRWEDCREPTNNELNVTSVIKIKIEEASAKIREGNPIDDKKDYETDYWAGVLPIETIFGEPIADTKLNENIDLPDYLQ